MRAGSSRCWLERGDAALLFDEAGPGDLAVGGADAELPFSLEGVVEEGLKGVEKSEEDIPPPIVEGSPTGEAVRFPVNAVANDVLGSEMEEVGSVKPLKASMGEDVAAEGVEKLWISDDETWNAEGAVKYALGEWGASGSQVPLLVEGGDVEG